MTKEDKKLLLIDLCARLPYKFKVHRYSDNVDIYIDNIDDFAHLLEYSGIDDIKPYLRSMSSMTEEEFNEFEETFGFPLHAEFDTITKKTTVYNSIEIDRGYAVELDIDGVALMLDWLNKNMFDYRGLIEKGLSLEAPNEMYEQTL